MGLVAMTYKINPDSEVEDVDVNAIASSIEGFKNDTYDVQAVEIKPLAFGLQFVQVHVVMDDTSGLSDTFEEQMAGISGVGEIEVLSMGLL